MKGGFGQYKGDSTVGQRDENDGRIHGGQRGTITPLIMLKNNAKELPGRNYDYSNMLQELSDEKRKTETVKRLNTK